MIDEFLTTGDISGEDFGRPSDTKEFDILSLPNDFKLVFLVEKITDENNPFPGGMIRGGLLMTTRLTSKERNATTRESSIFSPLEVGAFAGKWNRLLCAVFDKHLFSIEESLENESPLEKRLRRAVEFIDPSFRSYPEATFYTLAILERELKKRIKEYNPSRDEIDGIKDSLVALRTLRKILKEEK